jgi:hypothetical protein
MVSFFAPSKNQVRGGTNQFTKNYYQNPEGDAQVLCLVSFDDVDDAIDLKPELNDD